MRVSADGRVPVAGESHYQPALTAAARGRVCDGGFDEALDVAVALWPEPTNPYDRWAVRVDALLPTGPAKVGYLPADLCRDYHEVLRAWIPPGRTAWCPGKIMGGGTRLYGIHLHLGPAESLILMGPEPPVHACLLPPDRDVTVTGEEEHADVLEPFALSDRRPVRVLADLGWCRITKGKYAGHQAIEVRIGGRRIGQLTAAMSDRHAPGVQAVYAGGGLPICEAYVFASVDKGPQVTLRLPETRQTAGRHLG